MNLELFVYLLFDKKSGNLLNNDDKPYGVPNKLVKVRVFHSVGAIKNSNIWFKWKSGNAPELDLEIRKYPLVNYELVN